jgi:hypothetical protein
MAHAARIDMATESGTVKPTVKPKAARLDVGDLSCAAYGAAGGRQSATTRGVAKSSCGTIAPAPTNAD